MNSASKLTRRDFLRMGGMATALAALAACAPAPSEPKVVEKEVTRIVEGTPEVVTVKETVVVKEVQEQVTLRYAGWVFGNWQDLFDKLTARFTELNPSIKVTAELGDWTANQQKLFAEVAAGMPPDIGMGWWHQLIAEDRILDCTPFIERDSDFSWDNYFAFTYEWARYDKKNATKDPNGGTYIFPMAAYGSVLYYNKNLFDEAGVEYPKDDWSWQDLIDKAVKLTKDSQGRRADEVGFDAADVDTWGINGMTWYYFFSQYAWALGSDILKPDYSAAALNDQAWIDTFTFVNDAVNKLNVHPGGAAGGMAPEGGFMSGKLAMDFNMNWVLAPYLRDIQDFEWSMAPVPGLNGKRVPFASPDTNVMFRDAKHHEESWKFMKYFMSEEANRDFISKELPPPHKKVALSDDYLAPLAGHYPEALKIAWEEGRTMQADRAIEHWAGKLGDAMNSMVAGDIKTPKEACAWAAAEIDKVREQYIEA